MSYQRSNIVIDLSLNPFKYPWLVFQNLVSDPKQPSTIFNKYRRGSESDAAQVPRIPSIQLIARNQAQLIVVSTTRHNHPLNKSAAASKAGRSPHEGH